MEALLPLIITFGLMWALLIRPQQRRVRQHQELVATLAAGDEVITTGGIVGSIAAVVDDIVTLEVAPGTSIRVLRSAVQSRIAPFATEDADEDDASEDDDELFDEGQFEAEPAAEDPTPETPSIGDEPEISYIPPPTSPPPATPPPPNPPSTGEKA